MSHKTVILQFQHSMSHAPSLLFPSHLSTTSLSNCTPVRPSIRPSTRTSLLSTSHGDLPYADTSNVSYATLAETHSLTKATRLSVACTRARADTRRLLESRVTTFATSVTPAGIATSMTYELSLSRSSRGQSTKSRQRVFADLPHYFDSSAGLGHIRQRAKRQRS